MHPQRQTDTEEFEGAGAGAPVPLVSTGRVKPARQSRQFWRSAPDRVMAANEVRPAEPASWVEGEAREAIEKKPADAGVSGPSPRALGIEQLGHAILAMLMALILSPVFVALALLIRLGDGGPAIFRHRRIGHNGETFECLKFRSMAIDAEARLARLLREDPEAKAEWDRDHKLKNDPRVTRLGAFLRKSSLDEIPQLFNVIRGEMSLVGPRPIVAGEVIRYGRRIASYYSVRPGITGLWQVGGRNDVSYRRRVAMDVLYARKRNLLTDGFILLCTIPAVLLRKGSY